MVEDAVLSDRAFIYDVAFSFLAEDEQLAVQLNDLLQERVSTFLYSKRQKEIAGTDGEETFNLVFGKQARVVVVLYRSNWGHTVWTRIEETAIRNRAFDDGYDFVLMIPLEAKVKAPRWLPRNRIWIGLERWGVHGAASVIEARVQESGGRPHQESMAQKARRLKRQIDTEGERKRFISSVAGVQAASDEVAKLYEDVEAQNKSLRDNADFSFRFERAGPSIYLFGTKFVLWMHWFNHYANTLNDSRLCVELWLGSPPNRGFSFEPGQRKKLWKYQFDRNYNGELGWRMATENELILTNQLAERCVEHLIEAVHSDQMKNR